MPKVPHAASSAACRAVSWGQGYLGSLGLGSFDGSPTAAAAVPELGRGVTQMSAGWGHSAAVCEGGKLMMWGRPFDFKSLLRLHRLRRFSESFCSVINWTASWDQKTLMLSPSEMKLEDGEQAEFVCCSAGLTAVLTQSGKVYALGLNRWGQCGIGSDTPHHLYELSRVKLPEALNFSSIKLGLQHALALTNDGEVWAWGKGERGQLALDALSASNQPMPARALLEDPVASMDCGLNHSAAVTRDGRLFVWGKWHSKEVAKTRAGVAVYHDQLEPRLVEVGGSHSPVVDVVCSLSQTLIQTADGKVFICGMKEGSHEMLHEPTEVILPTHGTATNGLGALHKGWGKCYYAPREGPWYALELTESGVAVDEFVIPGMDAASMAWVEGIAIGWQQAHAWVRPGPAAS